MGGHGEPEDEDVRLTRLAYEAYNRGDITGVLERCHADIEWRMSDRFSRGGRVYRGHAGVREVYETFSESFEEFRTEPQRFVVDGERIVVPVRIVGRPRNNDAEVTFELVQAWTMRDRLAVRLDVFPDLDAALAPGAG